MKILSLVLASVLLVTMTSATSISIRELTNKDLVSNFLKGLLECLFGALNGVVGSDLTEILKQIQEAFGKSGDCVDINSPVPVDIIQCVLSKIGTISADDLAVIVKRLQPILLKLNGGLTCIRN